MTLDPTAKALADLVQQAQTVQQATAPSGGRAGQLISLRVNGRPLQARCLVSIAPGPVVAVLTQAGWACLPVAATRLVGTRLVEFRQRREQRVVAAAPVVILYKKALESGAIQVWVWDQGQRILVHTVEDAADVEGSIAVTSATGWTVSLNIIYADRFPNYEAGIFIKGGSFTPVASPSTKPSAVYPSKNYLSIVASDNGPTWRYEFATAGGDGQFFDALAVINPDSFTSVSYSEEDLDGEPARFGEYMRGSTGLMLMRSESTPSKFWFGGAGTVGGGFPSTQWSRASNIARSGGDFTPGEVFTWQLLQQNVPILPAEGVGDNVARIYNLDGLQTTINPTVSENRPYRAAGGNLIGDRAHITNATDTATIYRGIGSNFIFHITDSGVETTLNRVGGFVSTPYYLALNDSLFYGLEVRVAEQTSVLRRYSYDVGAGTYGLADAAEIKTGDAFLGSIIILDASGWIESMDKLNFAAP